MQTQERYERLSASEIAVLGNKSRSSRIALIAAAGSFIFMNVLMWFVPGVSWVVFITLFLFYLFAGWFVSRGVLRSLLSVNRDIRDGKKKIIVDRMESQRQDIKTKTSHNDVTYGYSGGNPPSMSYSYLLKVKGKEINVSEVQYYECKPGQLVEIHLAPNSEHVFYVNVLKDAATERATA